MLCRTGGAAAGGICFPSSSSTSWIRTNDPKPGWPDRCVSVRKITSHVMVTMRTFLMVRSEFRNDASAPLRLKSPMGQFLGRLQQSHPHLFSAAVEQQLENLSEEGRKSSGNPRNAESSSILYKRLAKLKAQERSVVIEEILYLIVTHRFLEFHITMLPCSSSYKDQLRSIETMPRQEKELMSIHSDEAQAMVWEHISFILGTEASPQSVIDGVTVQISMIDMGSVYASSAAYGYFVRRVDEKFQIEKAMDASFPCSSESKQPKEANNFAERVSILSEMMGGMHDEDVMDSTCDRKLNPLRDYVMSFDLETLYKSATLRSIEMANVIEKQAEALFGQIELQRPKGKDEAIIITLSGFERLVLEAVAFGSFLWDAETYVDSYCNIVK